MTWNNLILNLKTLLNIKTRTGSRTLNQQNIDRTFQNSRNKADGQNPFPRDTIQVSFGVKGHAQGSNQLGYELSPFPVHTQHPHWVSIKTQDWNLHLNLDWETVELSQSNITWSETRQIRVEDPLHERVLLFIHSFIYLFS